MTAERAPVKRVRPDDDRALKMLRVRPEFKKEPLSENVKWKNFSYAI